MAVRYPSTVSSNQTSLQNQIRRSATAPLGPVSVGPGEGHMRYYTSTGDTFLAEPSGASVKFRGALTGLTPHLESNATKNEQQDGRLTGHDNDVTRIDAKNTAQDGRLNGHDSTLSSHDTRISNEVAARESADLTLHGRVNTEATQRKDADSRLSSRISTAQSRADSAHTRIDNLSYASPAQIAQLSDEIEYLRGRVKALEDWRASLPGS